MNDALDLVWRRAELPNHVLSAARNRALATRAARCHNRLGLLRRTSDATALICEDCGPPHPVEVIRDPRKPKQPYYLCPEIGRVPLTPTDLQRWEADFDQIAVLIRRAVGLTAKAATLVPSRIWLLGRQQTEDRYWELFLMRGLCWPDGVQLLNQCSRVQQSPAPVVVVPYRLPSGGSAAPSWPIRTLAEVVTLAGSSLVVDIATLASRRWRLRIPPRWARGRRDSACPGLSARLKRCRVVTQYLQHTQMTDTQFGNQFQTTDKTVRKFLNSGQMRRSNFDEMAKSMGLTSEQLLRGELPPSMKQPARR